MADEEGEPPEGGGSEYDRMSLNSLRRELEVQKAKTEMARAEAHERIAESTEKKSPVVKIVVASVIGLVLIGGLVALARTELLDFEEWSLPEFTEPEWDAGPEPEPIEYFPDAGYDAGHDAGHRRHPHGHGHGPAQPEAPAPGPLDFEDSDDPLEGL